MNTITNYLKVSTGTLVGASLVLALAIVFVFPTKTAKASEFTNILVGQDLTLGSRGENVVVLQGLLSELGYLNVPMGIPFGYYGTLTKNAVANYQSAKFVSPAVGYYGPRTKTAMHSEFASRGWLNMLGW